MELRHLRYFLATAREGNMTRAAATCHVSQPALSRQLSDLERELGCELFVRESRGVTLTDEGLLLRKRAEEIVSLADRAELELRADGVQVEGDVWVGAGESRALGVVAQVAADLAQDHPGLRVRLYSGNFDDVSERVDKGLLDFGVVIGHQVDNRFDRLALPWQDRWGVLLRRDHPLARRETLTLDDLRGERLIVSGQRREEVLEDSMEHYLEVKGLKVVSTYTLLFNASLFVEKGAAVAVCFDGIVPSGEGTPFSFVPLEDLPPAESIVMWKRLQPQSRACQLFLRVLRERCGA